MYGPVRAGTRGGRAEFSWDDVKADKDRHNYLGNTLMAPVGKWQQGKDLLWYSKQAKRTQLDEQLAKEKEDIRRQEADNRRALLGLPPLSVKVEGGTGVKAEGRVKEEVKETRDGRRRSGVEARAAQREEDEEEDERRAEEERRRTYTQRLRIKDGLVGGAYKEQRGEETFKTVIAPAEETEEKEVESTSQSSTTVKREAEEEEGKGGNRRRADEESRERRHRESSDRRANKERERDRREDTRHRRHRRSSDSDSDSGPVERRSTERHRQSSRSSHRSSRHRHRRYSSDSTSSSSRSCSRSPRRDRHRKHRD